MYFLCIFIYLSTFFPRGLKWFKGLVAAVLTTVTVKDIDPWFPAASAAVQVIVVMPTGNRLPDEGAHVGPIVTPMLSFT